VPTWRADDAPGTRRSIGRRAFACRACTVAGVVLLIVGACVWSWHQPAGTASTEPSGAASAELAPGAGGRRGAVGPTDGRFPWEVPALFGAGLLAASAVAASRLRWVRRTLHEHPWVVADARVVTATRSSTGGHRAERALRLSGAPDPRTVFAAAVGVRSPSMAGFEPEAWVAGTGRQFLVAAPGGAPILRVRRVEGVS
jgi:hypothetical protein